MIDYQVVLMDMPHKVHETVTLNSDDSYTIIINARDCQQRQRDSFLHAIKHIVNNDFDKYDVNLIEGSAHAES